MPATSDARTRGGLQRRRIIERPRLLALLNGSPARVRTLIAPAGYGKTTLAEQWVGQEGRRHAWFTTRSSSTDVAALALGLARAATAIVPDCDVRLREHLRALPAPAEHVDVLAELLGEDLAEWPDDAWLVSDDYHELASTPQAERFVEELVAAAPVQLLIGSRQRPSWITARKILYGEVLELNQTELAMDGHEAAEVLTDRNTASASGLVALADGWPAVIGLASVSTAEIEHPDAVPEALYQFFAEEVFSALPADVQAGLETLAIAPVLDRTLAKRLLGGRCERICAAGLDVGILVERDAQLEIHPLARAFLVDRFEVLGDLADSDSVEACMAYFRERRDWDSAFELIVRRADPRQIEPLLEEALDELLETARLSTVEGWCEHAESIASRSTIVSLARAEVALRRGRLVLAQALAESVGSQTSVFQFRALCVAGRAAHLASREEEALHLFRQAARVAPTEALRRECLWEQFRCMTDLQMPEAAESQEHLAATVQRDDPRDVLRAAGCGLAFQLSFGSLDLNDADRAHELLSVIDDPIAETGFQSIYSAALVSCARYEDARVVARSFLAIARRYRLDFALPWALVSCARAESGLRNWHDAESFFEDALSESRATSHVHAEETCMAALIRTLSSQGRYDAALEIAPRFSSGSDLTGPLKTVRTELHASRALAAAAAGRVDEAVKTINEIRGHSLGGDSAVLIGAVEAVVALKRHDADSIERVRALWGTALRFGVLDMVVAAYRSAPEVLPVLLLGGTRSDERVGELVRRAGDEDLALAMGRSLKMFEKPEARLTAREREVYQLLREGLSNREIARLLVITEKTAKLHVQHVFDKLGVRSRETIRMKALLERSAQATSAIAATGAETGS